MPRMSRNQWVDLENHTMKTDEHNAAPAVAAGNALTRNSNGKTIKPPADASATLWKNICKGLGKRVGKDVVDRWFSDGNISYLDKAELRIRFPTSLHVTWAETYYRPDLERVIEDQIAAKPKITLEAPAELDSTLPFEDEPEISGEGTSELDGSILIMPETTPAARINEARLNPKHTFDSFVVGDNIAYCHATAMAVAERPGGRYNPVLFFGNSGLGKTALAFRDRPVRLAAASKEACVVCDRRRVHQ